MCPRLERNRFSLDLYPPNTGTRVIFIVPLLVRHPAEEMTAGARLHANQIGLNVRGVSQQPSNCFCANFSRTRMHTESTICSRERNMAGPDERRLGKL
jgi:hypothetical protein